MPRERIRVNDILVAASTATDIPVEKLAAKGRFHQYFETRQAIYYLASRLTHASFSEIARRMQKDHSTVLKGIPVAIERLKRDGKYRALIMEIIRHLRVRRGLKRLVDVTENL